LTLCWLPAGHAQVTDASRDAHLIVIGVDGLSVDGVTNASMPRLRELMARSAWTLSARGVMPTMSSPNWASMIDGAGPEQHGITSNGYLRKKVEIQPVCRDGEGMFPTIFAVLRAARPLSRIAVFHDWPGFARLVEKQAPDVLQHEHGAARTAETAARYWKQNHPTLMFVHLDNVDHAGHRAGWATPAYYRAVTDADRYIGTILDMLRDESALDSTFVLVTSDHGGKGGYHGKNSLAEIQIPWILSGPEIAPGEITAAVYTFDTAVTIAWIFGLPEPECWVGRPVLTAFQPAATLARAGRSGAALKYQCGPERPVITLASPAAADSEALLYQR
jgi:predicted AlkP superfamily pyrophosphatase or phosphodiesterase